MFVQFLQLAPIKGSVISQGFCQRKEWNMKWKVARIDISKNQWSQAKSDFI